jgi:DNA-binding IclR family transcriptional regulator
MSSAEKMKSVPAVDRVFTILEFLAASKRGLCAAELVEQIGMPRSSVHCLTLTLERRGYLYRNMKTGRYLLGLKLFSLAKYANGGMELRDRATPELNHLMQQSRLTVHLAVLEKDEAVLVAKVDSPGIIRLATWAGKPMEFHCASIGKAIAAHLPEEVLLNFLKARGMTRHNENTILCERRLREQLRAVRKLGYAVDDEEEEIGLRCIGVPVFDRDGCVLTAISIAGPTSQVHAENLATYALKVRNTAARISRRSAFNRRLQLRLPDGWTTQSAPSRRAVPCGGNQGTGSRTQHSRDGRVDS